jgi:hypothetical protein
MPGLLDAALVAGCVALPLVAAALDRVTGRRRRMAREELREVAEKPIATVKDGERVLIRGRTAARGALRASPVSLRACIGYHLTVDYRETGSVDSWHRVVEDDGFSPFLLADDTGEAVVHSPFEIRLTPHERFLESPPLDLVNLLPRRVAATSTGIFGPKYVFRYVEFVVMPGAQLIAVGRARIEIDQAGRAPSHREPPVMCHLGGVDERVVIADAN